MAITDIPLFSMLRTRMHWHQERQRLLAENVSHADTPQYRPRVLAPPQFDRREAPVASVGLARTDGAHIAAAGHEAQTLGYPPIEPFSAGFPSEHRSREI